ncbi:helix-turn-helix domain-containing protein [Saccharopolyspora mangrovi]|uniref:Helix-turn-helix domain-containing protein n=1 Tax=Saccharopolyspora mangrovi TaxID=3082379 RepID=A0ABU6A8Q8_9PSEU|nr:helix-turn-helix domain-containing protein [Saccharopolyspora sp. S2-29]MEB3367832.1 helix-turn-helix domain-containing protein [Saccharopolyspora sp. S2-29]
MTFVAEGYEVTNARRLGAVVRELRKERGWTQAKLSAEAHVSRGYLVKLEQGHPTAELRTVMRVLEALDAGLKVTEIVESPTDRLLREEFDRIVDG